MAWTPATFAEHFMHPLVLGGQLHVGVPLDAADLRQIQQPSSIPALVRAAIDAARARKAHALWGSHVRSSLDNEAIQIAVGLHNLLFLAHPACRRWGVSTLHRAHLVAFARNCLRAAAPATANQLVSRHTLVGSVPRLTRTDVEVSSWVNKRRFIGMTPPSRLLWWPKLRRVRQNASMTLWLESIARMDHTDTQRSLTAQLFRLSPLTDMLNPCRSWPVLDWEVLARYLRGKRIARVVAHAYVAQGLHRVGPPLAQSLTDLVVRTERAPELRRLPGPLTGRCALRILLGLVRYLFACCAIEGPIDPSRVGLHAQPSESLVPFLFVADHLKRKSAAWIGPAVNEVNGEPSRQLAAAVRLRLESFLEQLPERQRDAGRALASRVHNVLTRRG